LSSVEASDLIERKAAVGRTAKCSANIAQTIVCAFGEVDGRDGVRTRVDGDRSGDRSNAWAATRDGRVEIPNSRRRLSAKHPPRRRQKFLQRKSKAIIVSLRAPPLKCGRFIQSEHFLLNF
jgi:hypothetical protein